MPIKKILVTGSSGTIGTRLCERLLEMGYDVCGVDIKPNKWSAKINALTIIADLTDRAQLAKLPKGFDLAIHLAANARVYNIVLNPYQSRDNFEMSFNVLEHCRSAGIKRLIFASSREVYGNIEKATLAEGDAVIESSESPYSASKAATECFVRAYQKCYGIDFIITRFSNVYGMYDESDRIVPLAIRLCRENRPIEVFGKDKELDFTYIDDTVLGIVKCVEKFDSARNETFNIATGKAEFILATVEGIRKRLNSKSKISIGKNRVGEVVKFVADISKAKKMLGYSPKYSFEEGISKTVGWYLKNT